MLGDHDTIATLAVKDLQVARDFYERVLGLAPRGDAPEGVLYASGSGAFLVYPSSFAGTNKATAMSFQVPLAGFDARDRGVARPGRGVPDLRRPRHHLGRRRRLDGRGRPWGAGSRTPTATSSTSRRASRPAELGRRAGVRRRVSAAGPTRHRAPRRCRRRRRRGATQRAPDPARRRTCARPARAARRRTPLRPNRLRRRRARRCWSRRWSASTAAGAASAHAAAKRGRAGVVVGEPLDVVVEGVQAGGGQDADLAHAAAVALAPDPGLGDRVGRADEHRADRRPQALGQADADRCRTGCRSRRSGTPDATWAFHSRAPSRCMRDADAPGVAARSLADGRRSAAPCRRRSCGCSRPRRARSSTWYGPTPVVISASGPAGSSRPRALGQVRMVMPENAAAAPSSARSTCASWSADELLAGLTCSRTPSWLASDPVGVNSPASWPSSSATRSSSARDRGVLAEDVVADLGVRPSPRAWPAVGRVRVSERRSTSTGVTSSFEHLGDEERQLQGLLVVQARVAHRLVALARGRPRGSPPTPPRHSVTSSPVSSTWMPPGTVPSAAVHLEEALDLVDDVVEVAGLVAEADSKVLPCIGSQTQVT